jgi:transposase
MSVYVGIDVHRKRSQVAVIDQDGQVLANRNVNNGVQPILRVIGGLPPGTPAAFEARIRLGVAGGAAGGLRLRAAPGAPAAVQGHRLGAAEERQRPGAATLAQLLRADLLPEAWIAPPDVRQLRALLRHRIQLVRLRTLLRNRIHALLAGHGHDRPAGYWSGPGREWLASLELPAVSAEVTGDALALIDALESVTGRLDAEIRGHARSDPRVKVLTALPGVGPFTALVMLAEIGDITRFGSARKLASWAGLTPAVRGPDRMVRHGHRQAGLGLGAVDLVRGRADRQALTSVRRPVPGYRPPPRQEDRHHGDRPQAAHPRLPPAHRRQQRRCAPLAGRSPSPGHARIFRMSRPRRAR